MKIHITESQLKYIVKKSLNEDFDDVPYSQVAEKVWAGEIEPIYSIHDPEEDIKHCGNVVGDTPMDMYGRLFKGVDTGKIYFLEL